MHFTESKSALVTDSQLFHVPIRKQCWKLKYAKMPLVLKCISILHKLNVSSNGWNKISDWAGTWTLACSSSSSVKSLLFCQGGWWGRLLIPKGGWLWRRSGILTIHQGGKDQCLSSTDDEHSMPNIWKAWKKTERKAQRWDIILSIFTTTWQSFKQRILHLKAWPQKGSETHPVVHTMHQGRI